MIQNDMSKSPLFNGHSRKRLISRDLDKRPAKRRRDSHNEKTPVTHKPWEEKHSTSEEVGKIVDTTPRKEAYPASEVVEYLEVNTAHEDSEEESDPLTFWVNNGNKWPAAALWPVVSDMMPLPSAASSSISRKVPDPTVSRVTNQTKNSPYGNPAGYKYELAVQHLLFGDSSQGITAKSKKLIERLRSLPQAVPKDSLFDAATIDEFLLTAGERGEARVLRHVTPLLVPSVESLALAACPELRVLVESNDSRWLCSLPITAPRPQSDYAVGFDRDAFTTDEQAKLAPFVGHFRCDAQSYFRATYFMLFPFLSCEVKRGSDGIETADCQNAHAMFMAARGVVELYRLTGKEKELDGVPLAFSVSHNTQLVRVHGYYPQTIAPGQTGYYRHTIYDFKLSQDTRWLCYRFVRNVYNVFRKEHLARIQKGIRALPAAPSSLPLTSSNIATTALRAAARQRDQYSGNPGDTSGDEDATSEGMKTRETMRKRSIRQGGEPDGRTRKRRREKSRTSK